MFIPRPLQLHEADYFFEVCFGPSKEALGGGVCFFRLEHSERPKSPLRAPNFALTNASDGDDQQLGRLVPAWPAWPLRSFWGFAAFQRRSPTTSRRCGELDVLGAHVIYGELNRGFGGQRGSLSGPAVGLLFGMHLALQVSK